MSVDAAANAGTTAVRAVHRFDEARLALWMQDNVAGFEGRLASSNSRAANPIRLISSSRRRVPMSCDASRPVRS